VKTLSFSERRYVSRIYMKFIEIAIQSADLELSGDFGISKLFVVLIKSYLCKFCGNWKTSILHFSPFSWLKFPTFAALGAKLWEFWFFSPTKPLTGTRWRHLSQFLWLLIHLFGLHLHLRTPLATHNDSEKIRSYGSEWSTKVWLMWIMLFFSQVAYTNENKSFDASTTKIGLCVQADIETEGEGGGAEPRVACFISSFHPPDYLCGISKVCYQHPPMLKVVVTSYTISDIGQGFNLVHHHSVSCHTPCAVYRCKCRCPCSWWRK
jgi:hypothetical protein